MRKNERSVVLCLLEVARRAVKMFGFPSAPQLVRLEQEIEAELERETTATAATQTMMSETPIKRRPTIQVDMMSLDEMV